jgi:iron(III) transport system ATP-binding protein
MVCWSIGVLGFNASLHDSTIPVPETKRLSAPFDNAQGPQPVRSCMIAIRSLTKAFKTGSDSVRAVDAVDLQVEEKEFFVLLGLSGSGKTTLLRCVAGLEKPESGEIQLGKQIVSSAGNGIFVRPEDRALGMVFQSYAVWPHMTVFENVAFPLVNGKRKLPRFKVKERVLGALELVQLSDFANRPVPFLSGGQQQRVALARALAVEPQVLLMDEPLSNLDARLREEVRDEIRSLAKKLGITVLYVTHDQVEAMALADRIAVMNAGKILQIGGAQELYHFPLSRSVGEFLGSMNELEGTVQANDCVETQLGVVNCSVPNSAAKQVIVAIRPEDVSLSREAKGLSNEFPAQIVSQLFLGDITLYHLSANGKKLRGKTTLADPRLEPGRSIYVRLPAEKLKIFPM